MKKDYNKIMQQEISSFGEKPKLLLHGCCAPCSSAVIERIKEFFDITFYYYNPNIYPKQEFDLRQNEFSKLGVNVVVENYNHNEFLNVVKGKENEPEGGIRCQICIAQRMDKTFQYALNNNFDMVFAAYEMIDSNGKIIKYRNVINKIIQECKKRGITLSVKSIE